MKNLTDLKRQKSERKDDPAKEKTFSKYYLRCIYTNQKYRLYEGLTFLGRHGKCEIHLEDKASQISRFHCYFLVKGLLVFLHDNRSRNGTWVNGVRIKEKLLHPSDLIEIAHHKLLFWKKEDITSLLETSAVSGQPELTSHFSS